ncbi:MAG TPA: DUF4184 family protein [Anaerolineales bacterium]|nr:DUF4184 family protein [Anaerolineales bacterium]
MPMTFPAHQGLILPIVRRWPNSVDALALSVGAAMPDITDTILGFPLNGYFKQWYGHSLVGVFTLDLGIGLLITWLIAMFAGRLFRYRDVPRRLRLFFTKAPPSDALEGKQKRNRVPLRLWTFSVFIGILSHIGFDLISHDTNLLLYPWVEDPRWYPGWWYTIWFKIRPLSMFGKTYQVGVFSIIWGLLTLIVTLLFIRFLSPKREDRI